MQRGSPAGGGEVLLSLREIALRSPSHHGCFWKKGHVHLCGQIPQTGRPELQHLISSVPEARSPRSGAGEFGFWGSLAHWCRAAASRPCPRAALPRSRLAETGSAVSLSLGHQPCGIRAPPITSLKLKPKSPSLQAQSRWGLGLQPGNAGQQPDPRTCPAPSSLWQRFG